MEHVFKSTRVMTLAVRKGVVEFKNKEFRTSDNALVKQIRDSKFFGKYVIEETEGKEKEDDKE